MWIRVGNLYTTVAKASPEEVQWLWRFLSYEDAARERMTGQGTVRLLSRRHKRFPTGLVPLMEKHAKKKGFEVKRIDTRERPHPKTVGEHIAETDLDWLKTRMLLDAPYQFEAVETALTSSRGIIRAPTGAGKGEMVVGICKAVPCKWLFLVHRSHLAEDIQRRWEARGDGSGFAWLGKGQWELGERVTFCTFQTLFRALEHQECRNALQHVQGLIVDECHVVAASSFSEVAQAMPNAFYRIGLSGTPLDRSDGKSLMAIAQTGSVVYNVVPRDLMDAGYVATATVHLTTVKQPTGLGGNTWPGVRKAYIAESRERNAAVLKDTIQCNKPAMVFVDLLTHGRVLRDALLGAGIKAEFAWGACSKDKRHELVERMKSGDLEVLVANGVFREGVDIPGLMSVVYACGGKSSIQVIQGVGRGSRVTEDKSHFDIYDYRDSGHRWIKDHSMARIRVFTRYGYSVVDD